MKPNPSGPVQMVPIEFRNKAEAGDKFQFSKLFETLKVSDPSGRQSKLVGFEQVVVNFYALTDGLTISQVLKIPETSEPLVQVKEGSILNFFFPYIFQGDPSENCWFEITAGTGVVHLAAVGIVETSPIQLLG
jgi:hypothetical protein